MSVEQLLYIPLFVVLLSIIYLVYWCVYWCVRFVAFVAFGLPVCIYQLVRCLSVPYAVHVELQQMLGEHWMVDASRRSYLEALPEAKRRAHEKERQERILADAFREAVLNDETRRRDPLLRFLVYADDVVYGRRS